MKKNGFIWFKTLKAPVSEAIIPMKAMAATKKTRFFSMNQKPKKAPSFQFGPKHR